YRITPHKINKLTIAWTTWVNHQSKLSRLYEQGASQECIGEYVRRWLIWVGSGVDVAISEAVRGFRVWDERAVGFYGVDGVLVKRGRWGWGLS
ncbi:MAG: hypothetical protein V3T17_19945, partial [Pseudomonadales bacterium]